MIVAIGYVDVTLAVNCYTERRFELAFFATVLAKSMERRADVGVFSTVDDKHGEGAAHDWLVLNGDRYFMFAIHFWHVVHSVSAIPCN